MTHLVTEIDREFVDNLHSESASEPAMVGQG